MCGRVFIGDGIDYTIFEDALRQNYTEYIIEKWSKREEVFPSSILFTLTDYNHPNLMSWSYSNYGRTLINVRVESILNRNMYREDFSTHRCVIPVTGFYEWDKQKNRYYMHLDNETVFLAGLYQMDDPLNRFSIITRQADQTGSIHERIPLIIPRKELRSYMDHEGLDSVLANPPKLTVEAENQVKTLF